MWILKVQPEKEKREAKERATQRQDEFTNLLQTFKDQHYENQSHIRALAEHLHDVKAYCFRIAVTVAHDKIGGDNDKFERLLDRIFRCTEDTKG